MKLARVGCDGGAPSLRSFGGKFLDIRNKFGSFNAFGHLSKERQVSFEVDLWTLLSNVLTNLHPLVLVARQDMPVWLHRRCEELGARRWNHLSCWNLPRT